MILNCSRCGHSWEQRGEDVPKVCPKCKNPYWNIPRKTTSKEYIESMVKRVIEIHDRIIEISGGEKGVRDEGGIYHSIYAFDNYSRRHYNDPPDLGAFIFNEFSRKHHFIDGNKRIAYVFARAVMLARRYHFKTEYKEAVNFILKIAVYNSKATFDEIKRWLKGNCEVIEEKDVATYLNKICVDVLIQKEKDERKD